MAEEDFQEEEVWSYVKERKDGRARDHHSLFSHSSSSSSSSSRRLSSASRLIIPRANAKANAEESGGRKQRQQCAPVSIPDWSKIYRPNSNGSVEENANDNDDEFDDDHDGEQLPPHEWIAKKLARSQISSFSVCEGAGRTLKGRDQRKVRNAVLTKTGFLE